MLPAYLPSLEFSSKAQAMPNSRWGKAIVWGYAMGWWLYFAAAGVFAGPKLSFSDWQGYMGFQAFYAIFWPILVILSLVGIRW